MMRVYEPQQFTRAGVYVMLGIADSSQPTGLGV
jgi:hypothetical protein